MSIILFPGQGSQFVGMGQKLLHLPQVPRMFEIASDILKFDLLSACLNGSKEELDRTDRCQAAVFVTSLGAVELLKHTQPEAVRKCYATAGFSVGEYASLVLSDALAFEDALRLIKVRGDAMQRASEQTSSAMLTVFVNASSKLNLAMLAARKWCRKLQVDEPIVCEVANYLCSDCRVIGGQTQAIEFIEANQKEFGLLRVKRLPVSGAFHTRLMRPASEELGRAFEQSGVRFRTPLIKLWANYDAQVQTRGDRIKSALLKQVFSPVKWEQILNNLLKEENSSTANDENVSKEKSSSSSSSAAADLDFPEIYECGPAAQTGPVLRKINKKAFGFYKHVGV